MNYGTAFSQWREAAADPWQRYVEHAFVLRLADGSLPRDCYLHYLVQDYIFLFHFARAWALGATQAESLDEMRACSAMVSALIEEEMRLHIDTCEQAGISRTTLDTAEETSANLAYTRFVLDVGHTGDLLDLFAALAPCVFGYGEIGARLAASAHDPTYADWIAMYAGEDYQSLCHDVGRLIDQALEQRIGAQPLASPRWSRLVRHFTTATRLEIGFWEMGLNP